MTTFTSPIVSIIVHPYAKTHFVKDFAKTYTSQWHQTWGYIEDILYRLDNFILTTKVEMIHQKRQKS